MADTVTVPKRVESAPGSLAESIKIIEAAAQSALANQPGEATDFAPEGGRFMRDGILVDVNGEPVK